MDPFAKIGVRARVCVNVRIVGIEIHEAGTGTWKDWTLTIDN
jgi:hypothetical protein